LYLNKLFENVSEFKHLVTTLTNRNEIHDKIRGRIKSGNIQFENSYHPIHFPKCWRSGCAELILPVVLYENEIWFLTLR
jgi:hypothetical protein